jgi:hypothetical protein
MPEELVEDILNEIPSEDIPTDVLPDLNETDPIMVDKPLVEESKKVVPKLEEPKEVVEPEADKTVEELATKIGWQPNHTGKDYIDAATYILKSREIQETMKEHNDNLKGQLSDMQNSIESLKVHNEKVYKADVKRMQTEIEDLQKQKREAVELADVDKVDELDKQIDGLQKDLSEPQNNSQPTQNSVYADWIKDNQWYLNEPEMSTYAETVAEQYAGAPLDRLYKLVRNKVAEVFPEKFDSPKVAKVEKPIGPQSPVEASTNNGAKSTFGEADLTPGQLSIMNQFVRQEIMTKDQYINDVKRMQEA